MVHPPWSDVANRPAEGQPDGPTGSDPSKRRSRNGPRPVKGLKGIVVNFFLPHPIEAAGSAAANEEIEKMPL
jgi:hypothetical protein